MKRLLSLFLALIIAVSSVSLFASAETSDTDARLKQWEKKYLDILPMQIAYAKENEFYKGDKLVVIDDWVYQYSADNYDKLKEPVLVGYVGSNTDVTIPTIASGEKVIFQYVLTLNPIKTIRVPKEIEYLAGESHTAHDTNTPKYCFYLGDENLEEIIVDKDNKNYSSKDGVLYSKDGKKAYIYPSAKKDKSFTVPSGVEVLDWKFINNPKYLRELVIPNSVKFLSCTAIKSETLEKLYFKNSSLNDYNLIYSAPGDQSVACNSRTAVQITTPNAKVYCIKNSAIDRLYKKKLKTDTINKYLKAHNEEKIVKIWYTDDDLWYYQLKCKTVKYLSTPKTPKKPSVKSTSYTEKGIKLTLKDYSANGVKVYRKSGKTYKYIGYTTTKTFYDKTAKAGKTYTYKLRAYNKKNGATANSKYSAVFKVTAKPKTPAAVTIKSATYSKEKGVKLTVKDYSAKGVKVYRKSGKSYKYIGYTTTKTFYDKTAKAGKTYTYKVRAYNKVKGMTANSKYSAVKSVNTTAK